MERICTFFGHRVTFLDEAESAKLESVIAGLIEEGIDTFFFGGYSDYDRQCRLAVQKLKEKYPHIRLHYVTPYIGENSRRLREASGLYDSIIYPGLEDVHYKAAIGERNKYMVDKAECVVAHIDFKAGGAYEAYVLAAAKGKRIINLGKLK